MHILTDFKLKIHPTILLEAQIHERICNEKIKAFRLPQWMYTALSTENGFRSIVQNKAGYFLGYKVRNCGNDLPTMVTALGIEYLIFQEGD